MDHSSGFLNLVQDAKKRVRETTPESVRRRQETGERFHLVDVREDIEWERGHALGAIHLGKGIIERDVERAIPDRAEEIVLYCGGGFRSALAADTLRRWATRTSSRWTAAGSAGASWDSRSRAAAAASDPSSISSAECTVTAALRFWRSSPLSPFLSPSLPSAAPRPPLRPPIVSGR